MAQRFLLLRESRLSPRKAIKEVKGPAAKKSNGDVDDAGVISAPMSDIQSLVENFTNQLAALVEGQALDRARAAVESALGGRRPGRPPNISPLASSAKPRKKAPRQLCPVPGCKNPAAPVFGMVCAKHKDVAKTKIKKYREARKAKKLGSKPAKISKRRSQKATPPKPLAAAKPPVAAAA
jgi:hypothetical protein